MSFEEIDVLAFDESRDEPINLHTAGGPDEEQRRQRELIKHWEARLRLTRLLRKCRVCKKEDHDCLFMPCCDVVTCMACGQSQTKCIQCRQPITGRIKVYL